jgi:hypothetical protein
VGEGNRQKSSGRKGGIREKNRGWKKIVALGEKIENTLAIAISIRMRENNIIRKLKSWRAMLRPN